MFILERFLHFSNETNRSSFKLILLMICGRNPCNSIFTVHSTCICVEQLCNKCKHEEILIWIVHKLQIWLLHSVVVMYLKLEPWSLTVSLHVFFICLFVRWFVCPMEEWTSVTITKLSISIQLTMHDASMFIELLFEYQSETLCAIKFTGYCKDKSKWMHYITMVIWNI